MWVQAAKNERSNMRETQRAFVLREKNQAAKRQKICINPFSEAPLLLRGVKNLLNPLIYTIMTTILGDFLFACKVSDWCRCSP